MAKFKEILPHELANFNGLLCARALGPHRGQLSHHWETNAQGAVPRVRARHRFEDVIRCLHFSDNDSPDVRHIKTWKIQVVVDAINNSLQPE
ncbi:Hsp70-like protein [Phytophthora palmivora]|uniref:Hsp70-like protein n=1 Tax=Phytophthora palmivora TaxID=4796 RepID=A0A2P4XUG1_9STRA|nr:Hsp70-like protein [Phytophthora palmivora]